MTESIDELLSQLKAEYQQEDTDLKPKEKLPSPSQKSDQKPINSQDQSQRRHQNFFASAEEKLLGELKAEFAEKEQTEQRKRQQEQKEKELREKQEKYEKQLKDQRLQQQKREELTKQASEWLENLDFHSEVGLWFEEFAYSYPSKLDAAIDYLQALGETQP